MREALPTSAVGYAAFAFLGVSVVIHFLGGVTELYAIMTDSGTVAYAVLMLVGVVIPVLLLGAMVSGVLQPRATYATLSGMMVLYIIAYADVHALGYLESITGVDLHTHDHNGHEHGDHDDHDHSHNDHDHDHGGSVLDTVGDHLVDDPIALLSKVSEGAAAVCFALLTVREQ